MNIGRITTPKPETERTSATRRLFPTGRMLWLPIPLFLLTIVALWIANPRTSYESRGVVLTMNLVFTGLVSPCIAAMAGRGFLADGRPGLLMEELRAANEDMASFNMVAVGRELRMIELKKQVNELCAQAGQPPRYEVDVTEAG